MNNPHVPKGKSSTFLILCCALLMIDSGCRENNERREEKRIDTGSGVTPDDSLTQLKGRTEHPSGRVQIPTYATSAPDLFINLPAGYTVRAEKGGRLDQILILPLDSLASQGLQESTPPSSLLRIVIGDTVISMDLPGKSDSALPGHIGSYPVIWNRSRETYGRDGSFFSYETLVEGFFSRYDPGSDTAALQLHVYLGGTDSLAVELLLRSLSTLTARP